jgi:hypothetical protein
MRLIDPASCPLVPWKNGGGVGADIVSREEGDGRFAWRVGTAEIARDGPFSDYPDVDRVFSIVEGAGVTLTFAGRDHAVRRFEVLAFPGEAAPACRLLGGPARAFNLLLARGRWRGSVAFVEKRGKLAAAPGAARILYAAGAGVRVLAPHRLELPEGWAAETDGSAIEVEVGPGGRLAAAEAARA